MQYDPADSYPFEVEIRSSESPLESDSVVDLSHIRVVDIAARVTDNLGSVPDETISDIDDAIRTSLGLSV